MSYFDKRERSRVNNVIFVMKKIEKYGKAKVLSYSYLLLLICSFLIASIHFAIIHNKDEIQYTSNVLLQYLLVSAISSLLITIFLGIVFSNYYKHYTRLKKETGKKLNI